MDFQVLWFYGLFDVLVVVGLYGFSSLITDAKSEGKSRSESLIFQDKFDILLEMRLGGVTE